MFHACDARSAGRDETSVSLSMADQGEQMDLGGALERDDRQMSASGMVADSEFERDSWLAADQSMR